MFGSRITSIHLPSMIHCHSFPAASLVGRYTGLNPNVLAPPVQQSCTMVDATHKTDNNSSQPQNATAGAHCNNNLHDLIHPTAAAVKPGARSPGSIQWSALSMAVVSQSHPVMICIPNPSRLGWIPQMGLPAGTASAMHACNSTCHTST
jgi:hypothetical protein